MAISRYTMTYSGTESVSDMKAFLDLLVPTFFASVTVNDNSIFCYDADNNLIFKILLSNSNIFTAYRNANSNSEYSGSASVGTSPYVVKYGYIVGTRGAVLEFNGGNMLIISKTSKSKTGIVLPTSTASVYPVSWGDDPALTSALSFGGSMVGNQTLFVPIPLHGTYDSMEYFPDAYFMPMTQAGLREDAACQQLVSGDVTYLTNGYLALMDV